MRTRLLGITAALTLALALTLGGVAFAAGHGPATGSHAAKASSTVTRHMVAALHAPIFHVATRHAATRHIVVRHERTHIVWRKGHEFVDGLQRFEVYATNFQASFAPIYFTGVMTTAGIGYKDFAEFQDQTLVPKGNGTFVIFHPGLSQALGNTTTFDPTTCVLTITGNAPTFFIDGTGGFTGISAKGVVFLDIRVFFRVNSDGSCNENDPPWGYIEIARGFLDASIPIGETSLAHKAAGKA